MFTLCLVQNTNDLCINVVEILDQVLRSTRSVVYAPPCSLAAVSTLVLETGLYTAQPPLLSNVNVPSVTVTLSDLFKENTVRDLNLGFLDLK